MNATPEPELLAGIPENHRLHIHRRSPFVRNVVFPAINNRAIIHPGTKHSADGAPKLLPWIQSGNSLPVRSLISFLKRCDQFLQIVGRQFGVFDFVLAGNAHLSDVR